MIRTKILIPLNLTLAGKVRAAHSHARSTRLKAPCLLAFIGRIAIAGHDADTFAIVPTDGTPQWSVQRNARHASFIQLPVIPEDSESGLSGYFGEAENGPGLVFEKRQVRQEIVHPLRHDNAYQPLDSSEENEQ